MVDHIFLCGGNTLFRAFLTQLAGARLKICQDAESLPPYESGRSTLYVILPEYEKGETSVAPIKMERIMQFGDCKKNGARFYVENYPSRDYLTLGVFGFFLTGRMRHFYQENIVADNKLLQAGNAYYFPCTSGGKILAYAGDGIGLHCETVLSNHQFPILVDDSAGCVAAMTNLTCYNPLFMRPRQDWKIFFLQLWCNLLDVDFPEAEKVFENIWQPIIQLSGQLDEQAALINAVNWHLKSGLLPSADGRSGAYEMIRSDDLEFRANLRTDSILMTAALLTGAGHVCKQKNWVETGKNLADYILNRNVQTDDGFIHWYDNQTQVFSNDLGRHGLSLLYLWEHTGKLRYYQAALRLAHAALKWLEKEGICCGQFDTLQGYSGACGVASPIFHGEMVAFLLKMNLPESKNAVQKILDLIDLDSDAIGHSRPDVWSRALLMYCCAHQKVRDCHEEIQRLLDYYETLQDDCGGLREDDLFCRRSAPLEAGVAQGGGHDHIADQLYCNNYVFAALSVLRKKMADRRVENMYQKLKNFLLSIQIVSPAPRFNGAWMRAFDMEYKEYYGLELDRDWGPYCIMAGWTMGIIPLVFLDDLYQHSFFTAQTEI